MSGKQLYIYFFYRWYCHIFTPRALRS